MEGQERKPPVIAAFSPASPNREPLEFGLTAARLTGAPLMIVVVKPGGPVVDARGGGVWDSPDEERTIEHLRVGLQRRGLRDVMVEVVGARTTASGLQGAVEQYDAPLLVLGSSERGRVGQVLAGSTAERILHDGKVPVAVVPKGYQAPEGGVSTIGAAFGPEGDGEDALRTAAGLARARKVRLRAIVVIDPKHADEQEQRRADAEAKVRESLGALAGEVDFDLYVRADDAADGIVAAAADVDLLVIGTKGRGSRRAALFGSVSRKVADNAPCPILILPHDASAKADALVSSIPAPPAG